MHERSSKQEPKDVNEVASCVSAEAVSEAPPTSPPKNPAAVELGRRGGLKGGKARAEKLTPDERREIAQLAARARWKKSEPI